MSDIRSEAREFMGDDAAEASSKATSYFGVDASALEMKTLTGVSGLGSRVLVVREPASRNERAASASDTELRAVEVAEASAHGNAALAPTLG